MKKDDGKFGSERKELETYEQLHEQYVDWLSNTITNERTVERRDAGADAWLAWCEENGVDALAATEKDANNYIKHINENVGLADTTISSRFASVSKLYHWLITNPEIETELNGENPNADISLRKTHGISNNAEYPRIVHRQGRQDIIAPAYSDLKPLFDHPPGKTGFTRVRDELICRLLYQTAMRSDEASRIKLDKLNTDEREIEIRSAKLNFDDHPDLYHRLVFYEPELDYLIQRYIDKRGEKDPDGESPYLLVGNRGGQLSPGYISRIVKDAAHAAGIQEPLVTNSDGGVKQWLYTAHRLRHARISHLANHTSMDLNHIRMIAGHARIETTVAYVDNDWTEVRDSYRQATK